MPKARTKKTFLKRVKITGQGKILRRHQFGAGHLKSHKSKTARNRQTKTSEFFQGELKSLRKLLGL